jgi:hypothetical protein
MARAGDGRPRSSRRQAEERVSFRLTAKQKAAFIAARKASGRRNTGDWMLDLIATSGNARDAVQLWAVGEVAALSADLLPLLQQVERSRAAQQNAELRAQIARLQAWPEGFAAALSRQLGR